MTATHAKRRPIRRVLDAIPIDLLLVVAFALVVDALVLVSVGWAPLRFLLGVLFLFFVPGYAVVAALFPGRPGRGGQRRQRRPSFREPHDSLVLTERLAISVGTSVALIPVIAVVLGAFSLSLTPENVLASVTLLVLAFATVGAIRRVRLRPEDRFVPFGRQPARRDGGSHTRNSSRRSTLLVVGLVLAVGLAGGVFVYGIAAEPPSAQYTDAMLVTESEDGDYVAAGYPTNGTVGEPLSLTLSVDNHRDTTSNVTAVVVLERPNETSGGIAERERLTTLNNQLSAGSQWNASHDVTPTFAGENLRLAYYVYDGDVPSSVGPETADRELYLRIDVAADAA